MSGGDDFEARRLQNIERNEQFLKSIGLAEVKSSIENSKLDPDHTLDILDKHTKRRNKKPQSAPAVPRPHLRRPSRGAGGADTSEPDGGSTGSLDGMAVGFSSRCNAGRLIIFYAPRQRFQEAAAPQRQCCSGGRQQ